MLGDRMNDERVLLRATLLQTTVASGTRRGSNLGFAKRTYISGVSHGRSARENTYKKGR